MTNFNLLWVVVFILYTCLCLMYISTFEWLLHRYVMHRPFFRFTYAFKAHAGTHHVLMKPKTYHATNENRRKIPMAWWNGPLLITFTSLLPVFPIILGIMYGIWWPQIILVVVNTLYYITYELSHFWMHDPKERLLFKIPFIRHLFYRVNWHHFLHHVHQSKNFNVVWPFADRVFGTYTNKPSDPLMKAPADGQFPAEYK